MSDEALIALEKRTKEEILIHIGKKVENKKESPSKASIIAGKVQFITSELVEIQYYTFRI